MKRRAVYATVLVLATLVAAACTTELPPPLASPDETRSARPRGDPGSALEVSARQAGFELLLRADRGVYEAGEPIRVEAVLAPVGRGRVVVVSGSSTLVTFALQQLDGNRRMTPASTADCTRRELDGHAPLVVPFAKSGSPASDPANEAFWEEYFRGPQLRLPGGAWRIEGTAALYVGPDCSGRLISLTAPLDVVVEP